MFSTIFQHIIPLLLLFYFSFGWRVPKPPSGNLRLRRMPPPGQLYSRAIQPRIVGGRPVRFGEAPYHIRIEESQVWECGAALVDYRSLKFVITAAHCVWEGFQNATHIENSVIPKERLQLVGADLDKDSYQSREQWFGVNGTIIHGSYDPRYVQNDIALIFLDHYAFESLGLNVIPLPKYGWDDPNELRITGHGGKWEGDENRYLQIVELEPITRTFCRKLYHATVEDDSWTISENMLCGSHPIPWIERGTCFGDSGGPAIGFNYTENDWYLAGVLSWSNFDQCGKPGAFTVFTKVSRYVPWIKRMAQNWIDAHGTGNPFTNGTPTDR